MLCPIHGDVGSLDEIRAQVLDQNRDNIINHAKELVRKAIKDGFFKLK
jgi:hypothetical protein